MDDLMELNRIFFEHCQKAANKIEVVIEALECNDRKNGNIYNFFKRARVISSESQQQHQFKEVKGTTLIRLGSD